MMKTLYTLMAAFVIAAFTSSVMAAPKAELKVKPGEFKGTVFTVMGKTVENATLNLVQDDKVVATVKSDSKGNYSFADLKAGSYTLKVEEALTLALNVNTDATISSLRIVLPQTASTQPVAAAPVSSVPQSYASSQACMAACPAWLLPMLVGLGVGVGGLWALESSTDVIDDDEDKSR